MGATVAAVAVASAATVMLLLRRRSVRANVNVKGRSAGLRGDGKGTSTGSGSSDGSGAIPSRAWWRREAQGLISLWARVNGGDGNSDEAASTADRLAGHKPPSSTPGSVRGGTDGKSGRGGSRRVGSKKKPCRLVGRRRSSGGAIGGSRPLLARGSSGGGDDNDKATLEAAAAHDPDLGKLQRAASQVESHSTSCSSGFTEEATVVAGGVPVHTSVVATAVCAVPVSDAEPGNSDASESNVLCGGSDVTGGGEVQSAASGATTHSLAAGSDDGSDGERGKDDGSGASGSSSDDADVTDRGTSLDTIRDAVRVIKHRLQDVGRVVGDLDRDHSVVSNASIDARDPSAALIASGGAMIAEMWALERSARTRVRRVVFKLPGRFTAVSVTNCALSCCFRMRVQPWINLLPSAAAPL